MILRDNRFAHIQAVIVKLDDFLAIHTDEVPVPRMIRKIGIVERRGLTQTDLAQKPSPNKKGECAVDSGARDLAVLFAGAGEKGFGGEVLPIGKGNFRNGFSL